MCCEMWSYTEEVEDLSPKPEATLPTEVERDLAIGPGKPGVYGIVECSGHSTSVGWHPRVVRVHRGQCTLGVAHPRVSPPGQEPKTSGVGTAWRQLGSDAAGRTNIAFSSKTTRSPEKEDPMIPTGPRIERKHLNEPDSVALQGRLALAGRRELVPGAELCVR